MKRVNPAVCRHSGDVSSLTLLRNTPRTELLPYTARMVDDIAIVRSMHTEAINHEPAITFFQTGQMVAGRPCIGSWLSYGLGSMNQDLLACGAPASYPANMPA